MGKQQRHLTDGHGEPQTVIMIFINVIQMLRGELETLRPLSPTHFKWKSSQASSSAERPRYQLPSALSCREPIGMFSQILILIFSNSSLSTRE